MDAISVTNNTNNIALLTTNDRIKINVDIDIDMKFFEDMYEFNDEDEIAKYIGTLIVGFIKKGCEEYNG
jgi:hypothetical protein